MNPSITFSAKDTGGMSGAVTAIGNKLGGWGSTAASLAGSLKFKEASTMLTLVDNRSGVQLAATEGNSSKTDFGVWGGLIGSGGAGSAGGYTRRRRQGHRQLVRRRVQRTGAQREELQGAGSERRPRHRRQARRAV